MIRSQSSLVIMIIRVTDEHVTVITSSMPVGTFGTLLEF
jgi:hypothetical protein